jgi:hypothetical protein
MGLGERAEDPLWHWHAGGSIASYQTQGQAEADAKRLCNESKSPPKRNQEDIH